MGQASVSSSIWSAQSCRRLAASRAISNPVGGPRLVISRRVRAGVVWEDDRGAAQEDTRLAAAITVGRTFDRSRDPLGFEPGAPGDEELAAYFASLCALRPGTTLTVASGRIKRVGRLIGVDHSRGEPHLIIAQRAGEKRQAFTQYIPLRDADNVTVRGLVGCVESVRAPKAEDLLASEEG